jgi:hypothetical protein
MLLKYWFTVYLLLKINEFKKLIVLLTISHKTIKCLEVMQTNNDKFLMP